jgi:hypothetical protein
MLIPPYPSVPALAISWTTAFGLEGCQRQRLEVEISPAKSNLGHDSVKLILVRDVIRSTTGQANVSSLNAIALAKRWMCMVETRNMRNFTPRVFYTVNGRNRYVERMKDEDRKRVLKQNLIGSGVFPFVRDEIQGPDRLTSSPERGRSFGLLHKPLQVAALRICDSMRTLCEVALCQPC